MAPAEVTTGLTKLARPNMMTLDGKLIRKVASPSSRF